MSENLPTQQALTARIRVDTNVTVYVLRQTEEFQEWLERLSDPKARARIIARLRHVEVGNLGDWKSLGDGVSDSA